MSLFSEASAELADAILYEFGEAVTHRRGVTDTTITAVPSDPAPEDGVPGQYTVRLVLPSLGVIKGDKFVISTVVYDVFDVRVREGYGLARVFLSKS